MGLERALRQLEGQLSTPVTSVGLFAVPNPETFRAFMSLAAGAAALGGMSNVTGDAVDHLVSWLSGSSPRPAGMPHRVLVVVTPEAVALFADAHHKTDWKTARFEAGRFKAHASRYPFNIDLSITPEDGERLVLSGSRGPWRGVARTVSAVLALAGGSDRPGMTR
jgi:hypothetical protein